MPTYTITYMNKIREPDTDEFEDMEDVEGWVVGELGLDWERDVLEIKEVEE